MLCSGTAHKLGDRRGRAYTLLLLRVSLLRVLLLLLTITLLLLVLRLLPSSVVVLKREESEGEHSQRGESGIGGDGRGQCLPLLT